MSIRKIDQITSIPDLNSSEALPAKNSSSNITKTPSISSKDQATLSGNLLRARKSIGTQMTQSQLAAKLAESANRTAMLSVVRNGDDDAVRAMTDAQIAVATPDEKAVLVRHLLDGFTGNDDEQAILRILRSESNDVARFDRIINIVGMRNLVDNIHGSEFREFQQLVNQVRTSSRKVGDWDHYQSYLDTVTGTTVREGNSIGLLEAGEETFQTMFKAVDNAKETINFEMYELHDDKTGHEMVGHLVAAAKRGVKVNALLDGYGNLVVKNQKLVDYMKQNGINVIVNPFPIDKINVDHRKLIVIDGKTGFTGGMNIGDEYRYDWSDLQAVVEGPAVADMQNDFFSRWGEEGGFLDDRASYFPDLNTKGTQAIRVVPHNPGEDENIRNVYLRAIDTAERTITIQDPYFTDNEIFEHLKAAAARGVDVKIILPEKNDQMLSLQSARSHYKELLGAGIKIYEFQGRFAHEKVAVIDSLWATLGTSNLESLSLDHNQELNLVLLDRDFANKLDNSIKEDLANSKQITKPVGGWFAQLGQKIASKLESWIL